MIVPVLRDMSSETAVSTLERRPGRGARIRALARSGACGALTALLAACPTSDYWIGGDDEGATMTATLTGSPTPADLGPAPCDNGQLDPGEIDVDCGPGCEPCGPDQPCEEDGVCSCGNGVLSPIRGEPGAGYRRGSWCRGRP